MNTTCYCTLSADESGRCVNFNGDEGEAFRGIHGLYAQSPSYGTHSSKEDMAALDA